MLPLRPGRNASASFSVSKGHLILTSSQGRFMNSRVEENNIASEQASLALLQQPKFRRFFSLILPSCSHPLLRLLSVPDTVLSRHTRFLLRTSITTRSLLELESCEQAPPPSRELEGNKSRPKLQKNLVRNGADRKQESGRTCGPEEGGGVGVRSFAHSPTTFLPSLSPDCCVSRFLAT